MVSMQVGIDTADNVVLQKVASIPSFCDVDTRNVESTPL